ncbi:MAG TPA: Nif3-like dinuclear metal center hexameric protein, partial [Flavobacteriaceae bacterium]|nr:Nif3-like dinuclear metal center hexameric protein [Flavobacteriaceae bacterium]
MKVQDIAQLLDQLAPLEIAADFDNTGLLVGDPDASVEKILV